MWQRDKARSDQKHPTLSNLPDPTLFHCHHHSCPSPYSGISTGIYTIICTRTLGERESNGMTCQRRFIYLPHLRTWSICMLVSKGTSEGQQKVAERAEGCEGHPKPDQKPQKVYMYIDLEPEWNNRNTVGPYCTRPSSNGFFFRKDGSSLTENPLGYSGHTGPATPVSHTNDFGYMCSLSQYL